MNNHEDLLIQNENETYSVCLIIDDHLYHIKKHLKYAWKPRVFLHILQHIRLMIIAKMHRIPTIRLSDVLMSRFK